MHSHRVSEGGAVAHRLSQVRSELDTARREAQSFSNSIQAADGNEG